MSIILEDEEDVVKGAHYYLFKRYPLERLEKEILQLLNRREPCPSQLFGETSIVIYGRFARLSDG